MVDQKFSVLLPTYEGDDPQGLQRALNSVLDQTVMPDEVIVVADGPLTLALEAVIDEVASIHSDRVSRTSLSTNQGLGAALNHGVEACSHDLIARIDADDVAVETRFEQQLEYLCENPDVDVLGGYIAEFPDNPNETETVREVPTTPEAVRSKARFRCPVNHPSVMFRREAVLEAGNYRPLRSMQDYELWMRMFSRGYTIANLPSVLVKCEAGEDLFHRRGGFEYAKLEFTLQYEFWQIGMISLPIFFLNIVGRLPLRLAPNRLRGFVYQRLLRR